MTTDRRFELDALEQLPDLRLRALVEAGLYASTFAAPRTERVLEAVTRGGIVIPALLREVRPEPITLAAIRTASRALLDALARDARRPRDVLDEAIALARGDAHARAFVRMPIVLEEIEVTIGYTAEGPPEQLPIPLDGSPDGGAALEASPDSRAARLPGVADPPPPPPASDPKEGAGGCSRSQGPGSEAQEGPPRRDENGNRAIDPRPRGTCQQATFAAVDPRSIGGQPRNNCVSCSATAIDDTRTRSSARAHVPTCFQLGDRFVRFLCSARVFVVEDGGPLFGRCSPPRYPFECRAWNVRAPGPFPRRYA